MGVKLFTDQLQCRIVMNSITESLHRKLGGKLRPWMSYDDITHDQVLEKVANDKIKSINIDDGIQSSRSCKKSYN